MSQDQLQPTGPRDDDDILAGLWHKVLGRRPEPSSNFFELGGDSLRAAQLASQVRRALGKRVKVNLIFDRRRFADYAKAVRDLPEPRS